MITLSKGYLKPASPDTGDIFFPAMQTNIQMLNDHTHDGVTSQLLATTTQQILAANWVAAPAGGGLYRQLVTLPTTPSGLQYDVVDVWFKLSTGELTYPTVERASATTYYVYTIDNTQTYVANYR